MFYTFQAVEDEPLVTRVACVGSTPLNNARLSGVSLEVFSSELDLINSFVDIVVELDPDILTGWDVQNASWGYFAARAMFQARNWTQSPARMPGILHSMGPQAYHDPKSRWTPCFQSLADNTF
ncbi:hypothetical protein BDP27DRAFT_1419480 [Rhodocollybia butyracea]|uniref:DNA-directed DNA polymerase family B exonuclease domain-containing protein n=1 Tax=Rhodocollybia butyracea TaxID=206335 RepID=A0A9P5PVZ0_9AGAR|nr:hypothetical protein BDP27DRAFT_1419480 [Rhodocollybia butyracea]